MRCSKEWIGHTDDQLPLRAVGDLPRGRYYTRVWRAMCESEEERAAIMGGRDFVIFPAFSCTRAVRIIHTMILSLSTLSIAYHAES